MSRVILASNFGTIAPPPPPGPQWYVDNAVSSSGDGRSWPTAWKKFSNIAWGQVEPGDTINISGGTAGKTYREEVRPGASGSLNNPILIRSAVDPGHTGTVTIHNDGSDQAGFFIENEHDLTIRGFTITTPTNNNAQTDCIYIQSYPIAVNTYNIIIENNRLLLSNNGTEHDDCIQTAWGVGNLTIRNNYLEEDNNKTIHSQGMFFEGLEGTINIYNNIIYQPNSNNSLIHCRPDTEETHETAGFTAYIINNTLVGGGQWGEIWLRNSSSSIIKNNILYNGDDNPFDAIFLDTAGSGDPAGANIDYNIYYGQSGQPDYNYHNGQYISFTAWKNKGFDQHSRIINPQLVNIAARDFRIQSTSPAIDTGIADSHAPATDYAGNTRIPPPDIGAYEYVP